MDVVGGLESEKVQKEGLRRKELVKVLNRLEIISNPLNTMEVAKSTTHAHSSIPHPLKKKISIYQRD